MPANRRGRPRKWCSDNCRRRGHERGERVQVQIRERVVEREVLVPRTPVDAVDVVLDDPRATRLLLERLARQTRLSAVVTEFDAMSLRLLRYAVDDLREACEEAAPTRAKPPTKAPPPTPPAALPSPAVPPPRTSPPSPPSAPAAAPVSLPPQPARLQGAELTPGLNRAERRRRKKHRR